MLKIYMRLLGFARPIQKYAIPYFFYSLLYALFNSLTFLLIMPILKTMFDADYTFVYVEKLPPLAFNQEYLTALFNYTYSHLFNEYNPENVLLMLAVVTIFVSLLSNLFRYLGSWTVENMRTRTLQRMRNEMFSKVVGGASRKLEKRSGPGNRSRMGHEPAHAARTRRTDQIVAQQRGERQGHG